MSDIVERLRAEYLHRSQMENVGKDLKAQAADEIERLRAALREIEGKASIGAHRESLQRIAKAALNQSEQE